MYQLMVIDAAEWGMLQLNQFVLCGLSVQLKLTIKKEKPED